MRLGGRTAGQQRSQQPWSENPKPWGKPFFVAVAARNHPSNPRKRRKWRCHNTAGLVANLDGAALVIQTLGDRDNTALAGSHWPLTIHRERSPTVSGEWCSLRHVMPATCLTVAQFSSSLARGVPQWRSGDSTHRACCMLHIQVSEGPQGSEAVISCWCPRLLPTRARHCCTRPSH